ncbi:MAG: alpha/beta hydrolase [Pseudomonadota bacterium]
MEQDMPKTQDGTYWVRSGPQGAPSVVMIHGLGLNSDVWQWMRPALDDRYDVISYDLYGHGQSAPPPSTPDLSLFSDQLAGLLAHLGVARAAIIGFSLGGMICRRFAQNHPDHATALVILNSAHRRSVSAQAAIEARVEQARHEGPAATVEAALERWFTERYRASHPDMMAQVRAWVLANSPDVYPRNYAVLAHGVAEITQPDIALPHPALVMTAEEDWGNSPDMTRAIAEAMPNAEAVILPGLRHMALVENPAAVNQPVRRFLDHHLLGSTQHSSG